MIDYECGVLLEEGKTKKIWEVVGHSDLVIVEHKDTITAHDDPGLTREFATKARCSTITTSRVFEYLRNPGGPITVPVAYIEQLSDTEFVAQRCRMIPVEAVARCFPVGSYVKRHPEFVVQKGERPNRFDSSIMEFFLKTTGGELKNSDGELLIDGLDPQKGEEDPLVLDYFQPVWQLFHPKKPESDPEANLQRSVKAAEVLLCEDVFKMACDMQYWLECSFLFLEQAWDKLGFHLVDMKIEFGINQNGELVVADVIDNDSWRLRTHDWQKEFSKQVFRDGGDLSEVERNYLRVAELVGQFQS